MKKRRLHISALTIVLTGLIFLTAAIPGQAGNRNTEPIKAAYSNPASAAQWWVAIIDTWAATSPFRWMWISIRPQPSSQPITDDKLDPKPTEPLKLCGGDDGFIWDYKL